MRKLTKPIELELEVMFRQRPLVVKISPCGLIAVRLKGSKLWHSTKIFDPFMTSFNKMEPPQKKKVGVK